MPTVASKEQPEERRAAERESSRRTIRMIGPLVFMIVGAGQLVNQSRPELVRRICGGDQVKAAQMLATFGGYGGLCEFLLNPVMGRVSDRFGRRPVLLISPVACSLLRGLVFLFPGNSRVIMAERMLSSAVVTGFFSTMRASLNDRLSSEELIIANGAISVYAGLGLVLGPYLEVLVLRALGARANFAAISAVNAVVAYLMWKFVGETLPVDEQKPLTVKDCSPLTFVEMVRLPGIGPTIRRLMLILLLQSFGEERINQDINQINLHDNLKWTPGEISSYQALFGACVIAGGKAVKYSIETLGLSGHTTMSNLAMAGAFYCQGMQSKYASQLLALFLTLFGGRKRDAVESTCSALTLQNSDMGRGQVSAALSNFKSLAMVLGPPITGKAYAYGQSIGKPGVPYRLIAILYIVAELVHQSLGRKLEANKSPREGKK